MNEYVLAVHQGRLSKRQRGAAEPDRWESHLRSKRNFFVIQRHQATAHHYDLRLRLDDDLISWAIPKGPLGLTKDHHQHQAVETTLHNLNYAVVEGSESRAAGRGTARGTMVWDIGRYSIVNRKGESDDDNDSVNEEDDEDEDGAFEEAKLRHALKVIKEGDGEKQSFHIILHGQKLTNHDNKYKADGGIKRNCLVVLPGHRKGYPWGAGGEDGDEHGRSVKTGRTFAEVCNGPPQSLGDLLSHWQESCE
ncbi:uncharacterized protein EHS24_008959 [Apiotrichum porosum]|uniref:DNA ligase D 3'-phosphoesterase domain-containing protein n=1 Tax=Apiotrichum porosum TaxID=105984 RepID=A0A427XNJ9_9TREE|nr:uncharacterized protein EHS24_008959 [Apiotrichum porosum]RSH80383.1 hypothetical protein EHS24_008959 [Apiotrichum porosum]